MIAIISSAKTMDFSPWAQKLPTTKAVFTKEASELVLQLQRMSARELAKLMKISTKLAELNQQRFGAYDLKKNGRSKPSILAYQGDVYQGLDASTLTVNDLLFLQSHLRIISGLYGLLRPTDLIQAYRLEMSTKLKNIAGKDLYVFWQKKITKKLNQELAEQQQPYLINLASEEYSSAILLEELQCPFITVSFKQKTGNTLKNIGLYAKRARGLMARAIAVNKWDRPTALKDFAAEDYHYDQKISDDLNYVFVRKWK